MLQKLTVYDTKDRALVLTVECLFQGGMALEVIYRSRRLSPTHAQYIRGSY